MPHHKNKRPKANGKARPDDWPHPANFPVGSPESRAAARALAEQRDTPDDRVVVHVTLAGGRNIPEKSHSYRCKNTQGQIIEVVIIQPDHDAPEYREYRRRVGIESD